MVRRVEIRNNVYNLWLKTTIVNVQMLDFFDHDKKDGREIYKKNDDDETSD